MSGLSVGGTTPFGSPAAGFPHPSAPIPVQGAGVGSVVRAALGDSGFDVFPLFLGAAEFGWNVDIASSHAILDTYAEERGFPPYHPGMMVALLLYGYSRGLYSSRQLARACEERVDVMAVTGLNRPDFRTIADTYARVMKEDKALCDRAQANLNAGVFINGELHPRWEKGT